MKLLTVFGATGLQGGSIIRAVQNDPTLSKEFRIRGISRDSSSEPAKKLIDSGVEIISANQTDYSSLSEAVKGSDTVFLVTSFENALSFDNEVQQGKNVVDACRHASVKHLIFSSLTNISNASNGTFTRVYHFDSKAVIEEYIRESKLPSTFILYGSYMQNLFRLLTKKSTGTYELVLPTSTEIKFPFIDIESDAGKFGKIVLRNQDKLLGKRIYAAERYYTASEIIGEFKQVTGIHVEFNRVTPAEFENILQESWMLPKVFAEDMTEMAQAFVSPGYYGGVDLDDNPVKTDEGLVSLREFLERHKSKF